MTTKYLAVSVSLVLVFVVFLPQTEAVVPPPDGGYPGFTTAEGTNALKNLTTGVANTATGWYSLFSVTTGSFNTGLGGGALALNQADSNTAVGAAALLLNTTGTENTAIGTAALVHNDTAGGNSIAVAADMVGKCERSSGRVPMERMRSLATTSGQLNTAMGAGALFTDDNGFNGQLQHGRWCLSAS